MSSVLEIMKEIVGTLNVRGCRDSYKLETICNDIGKYKLQIIGITDTHVVGEAEIKKREGEN